MQTNTSPDVESTLVGLEHAKVAPWRKALPWAIAAIVLLAIGYFWLLRDRGGAVEYVTRPIARGGLTVTVTATGNLEPVNQVDIGSELSGTIRLVNVDFNDIVKKGQVLATLDKERLKAQVLQAQSALDSAHARVLQASAAAKQARANYQRLLKVRELSGNKLPSQQDLDVAESTVANADGERSAAVAAVEQNRASLATVQTDLSKTDIRSPIDGVVLVRSVEPGNTVASSLQAPVLFTLAEDLKKMELHVLVDEADVGSVEVGQQATFTVDAYPNRTFAARITQVHFASNNMQKSSGSGSSSSSQSSATSTGVVTYETVLEVDNSDLALRPGMTATAEIVTTTIDDALLVPNAALRFTPEGAAAPGQAPTASQQRGPLSALMPQFPRRQSNNNQRDSSRRFGRVWVLEQGKPVLVMFKPGATDGRNTQVLPLEAQNSAQMSARASDVVKQALARKLEPGMNVIIDSEHKKK